MNRAEAAQMNIDLEMGEIDKTNAKSKSKSQRMQPTQRANQNNTAGH
jgi:hypothetical protein